MTMYLVHHVVMIKVDVSEAKTRLSALLQLVQKGQRVQICIRNVPAAELRPLAGEKRKGRRPLGRCRGQVALPATFFQALPGSITEGFESPA